MQQREVRKMSEKGRPSRRGVSRNWVSLGKVQPAVEPSPLPQGRE